MSDYHYPPDPTTVNQWFCPGLWADFEDQIHLDAGAMCASQGIPLTSANLEMCEEEVKKVFRDKVPKAPIITLFDK